MLDVLVRAELLEGHACCSYNVTHKWAIADTVFDLQMEEDFVKANPLWVSELEIMVQSKVKAEIQALSSFGFQYLSQVYLPLKLQEGDWI